MVSLNLLVIAVVVPIYLVGLVAIVAALSIRRLRQRTLAFTPRYRVIPEIDTTTQPMPAISGAD
jgi:uncharacterized membrane protein YhaH (DUF805 family)